MTDVHTKLQEKLQETAKLLSAGKGNRDETATLLADAAERIAMLELANKRLREDVRGPAQVAWTQFMSDALNAYCSDEDVVHNYTDLQWEMVLDNCDEIADRALMRWKLRWVEGIAPKRRRPEAVDPLPKPDEIATPEQAHEYAKRIDDLFAAPPKTAVRMVDAASPPRPASAPSPPPKPLPAPRPEPHEPAHVAPTPKAEPAPDPPKVDPPRPAPRAPEPPRERQPGDDD